MAKKKDFKLRMGAKTASKGLEKDLKRRAKRLAQDPGLALPVCTVVVPYFKKLESQLRDISSRKDDKAFLERASKKGERLARAYAGALLLIHEEKIPYLAIYKTPYGDFGYALRGETGREMLLGLQNYEDPRLKLMAYMEEVKKRKLYMFVTEDNVICTGTDPKPPKEVIEAISKKVGKGMKRTSNVICSSDLDPRAVSERRPWKEPYIVVRWVPAGLDISRSLTSAKLEEDNIFATSASFMASTKIASQFEVEVVVNPICDKGKGCPCSPPPAKKEKLSFWERLGKVKEPTSKDLYLQGKMMDHRLIEKEEEDYIKRLKEAGTTVYILENKCLGSSKGNMLSYLKLSGSEREVMEHFLSLAKGPILSLDPSPNKIMAPFWQDVGMELLERVLKDKQTASKVFSEFPVPRFQPSMVIDEGRFLLEERSVKSILPRPKDPPRMIEFAYECAVAYLVRGKAGASKVLERFQDEDIKVKAAKYAFVKHLDLTRSAGWSYTTHEVGYAQGMETIVEKLVRKEPRAFREGLIELWKATGSTQDLDF